MGKKLRQVQATLRFKEPNVHFPTFVPAEKPPEEKPRTEPPRVRPESGASICPNSLFTLGKSMR